MSLDLSDKCGMLFATIQLWHKDFVGVLTVLCTFLLYLKSHDKKVFLSGGIEGEMAQQLKAVAALGRRPRFCSQHPRGS